MEESRIYLKFPTMEDKEAVLEYKKEFLEEYNEPHIPGSGSIENHETYESWLNLMEREVNPETCGEGRVPSTQYLTYRKSDNKLVGVVQIRHKLNNFLLNFGGHIGDSVRPTERRKGYATEQIKLAKDICRGFGIDRVLITCNKDNIASAKSIKNNGGILENEVKKDDGEITQRYWITL